MKNQDEIKAEIAALEACKSYAPRTTLFGDDNHAKIDLQIEYLRGNIDTTEDESDDYSDEERDAIQEAENWENGDAEEAPSAGWAHFKK